jgi:hypothetical protein
MRNKKTQTIKPIFIAFGSLVIAWLILLTSFTVWAWNIHLWQTRVDNDAIYNLAVDNAKQQNVIDKLQK